MKLTSIELNLFRMSIDVPRGFGLIHQVEPGHRVYGFQVPGWALTLTFVSQ